MLIRMLTNLSVKRLPMAKMKECPVCGTRVKLENLESHMRRVHPRVKLEAYLSDKDKTEIKIVKKKEKKAVKPFEEQERRRWALAGVLVSVIVVVLVILLTTVPSISPGCNLVGQEAPLFSIGDVEGQLFNLNDHVGKPLIIEFFATTCSACLSMAPVLTQAYEYYGWGEQIDFVSMSSGESVGIVRDFRDYHNHNWTYIADPSHTIADDYCIQYTPTFFIIDENLVIVESFKGSRSLNAFIQIIDGALQG